MSMPATRRPSAAAARGRGDDAGTPSTRIRHPKEPQRMEAFRIDRPDIDDALDLEAFEAGLTGSILLPGSPEYDEARRVKSAINDRHPALIVRAADADRRLADGDPGARVRSAPVGPRRRPQPGRPRHERRRHRARPRRDEGPPHRSRAAPRLGAARPDRGRVHRRGGSPRPRHPVRRHRLGRHLRADARRRDRLAGAQVRAGHRRPRRGRDRHRRRPAGHRQRRVAPGPVLGGARWRRQLRRRDPLPVQALPGRRDPRRRAVHAGHPRRPARATSRSPRAPPTS